MKKMKGMFSIAMLAIAVVSTGFVSYAQEKNSDQSPIAVSVDKLDESAVFSNGNAIELWVSPSGEVSGIVQAEAAQQKQSVFIYARCLLYEDGCWYLWAHATGRVDSRVDVYIMSDDAIISETHTIMPGCQDSEPVTRGYFSEDLVRNAKALYATPTEDATCKYIPQ